MAEIINKLLIIEDDEALVKMYSIKFKNAGFELLEKLKKSDYINKNKIVIYLTNLSLDTDRKK